MIISEFPITTTVGWDDLETDGRSENSLEEI